MPGLEFVEWHWHVLVIYLSFFVTLFRFEPIPSFIDYQLWNGAKIYHLVEASVCGLS